MNTFQDRASALVVAREVLSTKHKVSPFAGTKETLEPFSARDLMDVANWLIRDSSEKTPPRWRSEPPNLFDLLVDQDVASRCCEACTNDHSPTVAQLRDLAEKRYEASLDRFVERNNDDGEVNRIDE